MFEHLGEQIHAAIRGLRGQGRVSDINIATTLKDIRRALVAADVEYKLAKELTDKVKAQALGEQIKLAVSPGQHFTKLMAEALTELMGSQESALSLQQKPSVILVAGLQGSGKTTFCAKLALRLKKQGLRTAMVACDVHRPAAIQQLETLGKRIEVPVHQLEGSKEPLKVAKAGMAAAQAAGTSVIIVDTAGRLAIDTEMMSELRALKSTTRPEETLFVLDAMMGQDAVKTATAFQKEVDFEGIVLTKLDADSRGGAALSVKALTGKPIKFSSQGEDLESLDIFYPDRMAKRILGMGDVLSLVEKAQAQFDEKEARALNKKIQKNNFDLNDFLKQLQRIRKMGNVKDLIGMLPGMKQKLSLLDPNEDMLKGPEVMIQSMTPYERKHPDIIKKSRKIRIAQGSGTEASEVTALLKRYEMLRKIMKKAQSGNTQALQHMMQGQPFK